MLPNTKRPSTPSPLKGSYSTKTVTLKMRNKNFRAHDESIIKYDEREHERKHENNKTNKYSDSIKSEWKAAMTI